MRINTEKWDPAQIQVIFVSKSIHSNHLGENFKSISFAQKKIKSHVESNQNQWQMV